MYRCPIHLPISLCPSNDFHLVFLCFQNGFYNFASEIQNCDLKTRLYDNKRYTETGVGFQSEGCGEQLKEKLQEIIKKYSSVQEGCNIE